MRRAPLVVAAALVVLGAAVLFVPFLTRDRELVALTPSPPAAASVEPVPVPAGRAACARGVEVDPRSDLARFTIDTYGRRGPVLTVTLDGRGYRQAVKVDGGYADSTRFDVPIRPPARPVLVRACFTNEGSRRIALFGTIQERDRSRPTVTVAGRPSSADISLSFYERGRESIAARLPVLFDRAAAFNPWGRVGLWALAILVLLGVPGGALWAWSLALSAEPQPDRESAARRPSSTC